MDKETLSNYGWIVILVLILSVLLALATPFGNFIAGAIKSTTAGFFGVNENALDSAGITVPGQEFDDAEQIPIAKSGPGLYKSGTNYTEMIKSWDELIAEGIIIVENGAVCTEMDFANLVNYSAEELSGDLWILDNGSITKIGTLDTSSGVIWGKAGFFGCINLTGIKLPNGLTELSEHALSATSIKTVDLPTTLTAIHDGAFYGCTNLERLVVPSSVTELERLTFSRCTKIQSVGGLGSGASIELPNTITTEYMDSMFEGCSALTTAILPSNPNITHLNSTFTGCTSLTKVVIPDTVTKLSYTFQDCYLIKTVGLTGSGCNVEYSNNITEFGYNTFDDCIALESIILPQSITLIGRYSFEDCNLKSVTFADANGWSTTLTSNVPITALSSDDLSDPTKAAELLGTTYVEYGFVKEN